MWGMYYKKGARILEGIPRCRFVPMTGFVVLGLRFPFCFERCWAWPGQIERAVFRPVWIESVAVDNASSFLRGKVE